MIAGIIICHGQLAFELKNAAEKILGPSVHLLPFSNDGINPKSLFEAVREGMAQTKTTEFIVFVDMRGGSCWSVAKMLSRDTAKLKILSGVNLPMVTAFLTKRKQMPLEALAKTLETDAHRGVVLEE